MQYQKTAPEGTFAPGTKIQVGLYRVIVERYLSEGGFAHVYVVRVPVGNNKYDLAVLKRVAVPDKDTLANVRKEVETMMKLRGHKHIVRYIDSHASQLKGGGYEVFVLMEYCSGGTLIDFMNTRLYNRLNETEILHILSDITEGVAAMHYLDPPLLHRDLKIENVLISHPSESETVYKVCDFGSAATRQPAATNSTEARRILDDIQRHTTMQYRSPEMIDVYRKREINEKSDIWALGVLLYKLCYYTTPFETRGQTAILNAEFTLPTQQPDHDRQIKEMIIAMLRENPAERPNIYQMLQRIYKLRDMEPVPIKNIYGAVGEKANMIKSMTKKKDPSVGISSESPSRPQPTIPDITPMRRGRPTKVDPSKTPVSQSPIVKDDPFAGLQVIKARTAASELTKKVPSLKDFSIALNGHSTVDFVSEEVAADADKDKDILKSVNKKESPPRPPTTQAAHQVGTNVVDPKVDTTQKSPLINMEQSPKKYASIWRVPNEQKFSIDRPELSDNKKDKEEGQNDRSAEKPLLVDIDASSSDDEDASTSVHPPIKLITNITRPSAVDLLSKSAEETSNRSWQLRSPDRRAIPDKRSSMSVINNYPATDTKHGPEKASATSRSRLKAMKDQAALPAYRSLTTRASDISLRKSSTTSPSTSLQRLDDRKADKGDVDGEDVEPTLSIKDRMKSLIDEGQKPVTARTAAGYGRYTDDISPKINNNISPGIDNKITKPVVKSSLVNLNKEDITNTKERCDDIIQLAESRITQSASAPPSMPSTSIAKPAPNLKSLALRNRQTIIKSSSSTKSPVKPVNGQDTTAEWKQAASLTSQGSRLAALLAKDQEGVAKPGAQQDSSGDDSPLDQHGEVDISSLVEDFSKRYPSIRLDEPLYG